MHHVRRGIRPVFADGQLDRRTDLDQLLAEVEALISLVKERE